MLNIGRKSRLKMKYKGIELHGARIEYCFSPLGTGKDARLSVSFVNVYGNISGEHQKLFNLFICQNEYDGITCKEKFGYRFSWYAGKITQLLDLEKIMDAYKIKFLETNINNAKYRSRMSEHV